MQKIDASVTPIQWPVSLGVALKAEGPLTTKTRHSHVAKGGTYETLETQEFSDPAAFAVV